MSSAETTEPEQLLPPLPAAAPKSGGIPKVVLIVLGIIVFLGILGAAAYFILTSIAGPTGTPAPTVTTTGGPVSTPVTTATPVATGTPAPIPTVTDRDIYTPRNPFEVITPTPEETETTSASNETSGTLYLRDIVTENGVRKAVVRLNGVTYTLAAGSTVDSSPWKIDTVSSSGIVALYGDERVTISLGQGTSK